MVLTSRVSSLSSFLSEDMESGYSPIFGVDRSLGGHMVGKFE